MILGTQADLWLISLISSGEYHTTSQGHTQTKLDFGLEGENSELGRSTDPGLACSHIEHCGGWYGHPYKGGTWYGHPNKSVY